MKIIVERSGGFTGISISNELDVQDLPPSLSAKLKKIIQTTKSNSLKLKKIPSGSADRYHYKIILREGQTEKVIECNESNMISDLRPLVKFIEKNPRK